MGVLNYQDTVTFFFLLKRKLEFDFVSSGVIRNLDMWKNLFFTKHFLFDPLSVLGDRPYCHGTRCLQFPPFLARDPRYQLRTTCCAREQRNVMCLFIAKFHGPFRKVNNFIFGMIPFLQPTNCSPTDRIHNRCWQYSLFIFIRVICCH